MRITEGLNFTDIASAIDAGAESRGGQRHCLKQRCHDAAA